MKDEILDNRQPATARRGEGEKERRGEGECGRQEVLRSRSRVLGPSPSGLLPPLRVLQICPSVGTACGVANFAVNLAAALSKQGFDVRTAARFRATDADVVLVQHEFGLFDTAALRSALAKCRQPKILFCHTAGGEIFQEYVDGFMAMCPDMVHSHKPVGTMPHPGWYSGGLADRRALQKQFGYRGYSCVVGSNGFITPPRRFRIVTL